MVLSTALNIIHHPTNAQGLITRSERDPDLSKMVNSLVMEQC